MYHLELELELAMLLPDCFDVACVGFILRITIPLKDVSENDSQSSFETTCEKNIDIFSSCCKHVSRN